MALLSITGTASSQTLQEAVIIALNQYPSILAAQSKLDAAGYEITRAQGSHWPQVAWVGTQNAYNTGSVPNNWIQSPNVSLNVWSGWKIQSEVERTQALAEAGKSQQRITRDDVALLATEGYLNWARCLELLRLARENRLTHQKLLDDIEKIVIIDQGRRIDLAQAQVRYENANLSVSQREIDLSTAVQRLHRMLLGQVPGSPSGVDFAPGVTPASSDQALILLDDNHPVIAQQISFVNAAHAAVRSARSEYSPTVNVTYGKQTYQGTGQGDYLAQLVVNIPIFSGGSSYGSTNAAQSSLQAAEFNLQETRLILREKITATWAEWLGAKERQNLSVKQIKISHEIVQGYWKQFQVGRRSLLDLLNVQSDLYTYQTTNVTTSFDALIARARVMSLIGRLAISYQSQNTLSKKNNINTTNDSNHEIANVIVPKLRESFVTTNIISEGGLVQTATADLVAQSK